MFDLRCGIRLRAFQPPPANDLDNILGLFNTPQVAQLMSELFLVPRGEDVKKAFQENIDKNAEIFCIIETIPTPPTASVNKDGQSSPNSAWNERQFVGIANLWARRERGHRHSTYGITLLPAFWNKGYGTEITKFMVNHAFLHLNMHRISLEVYEGNDRAAVVYKKCGFIEEGRQRKAVWINGGWRDIIQMGILVEDLKRDED